ncbi:MAG TPA: hypothetical protein VFO19_03695 [Vicinamibacterales bacterium]|nr:hypothetical protein [Vicinamibacterales bacterium]
MAALTRRRFVVALALGTPVAAWPGRVAARTERQNGLDRFVVPGVPCNDDPRATPRVEAGPEFRPGAPKRLSLVERGVAGTRLVLTGVVAGLRCGTIAGARVDFWQADPQGRLDAEGFRFRGHQLTGSDGSYRLETLVPGSVGGRAPRIGIRIEVPNRMQWSSLIFLPDHPANAADPAFKRELTMTVRSTNPVQSAIFNVTLDL